MTSVPITEGTPAQRWLARLSFALVGLAIVILILFAELKSLAMLAIALVARAWAAARGWTAACSASGCGASQAVDLLRGGSADGVTELTAKKIEITAGPPRIPVGIDGEAVTMPTPVTCSAWRGALRVWVPRDRPGVPEPESPVDWARLRRLAGRRRKPAEVLR